LIALWERNLTGRLLLLNLVRQRYNERVRQSEEAFASQPPRPASAPLSLTEPDDAGSVQRDLGSVLSVVASHYRDLPATQDAIEDRMKAATFAITNDDAWLEAYLAAEYEVLKDAFARLDFLDTYYRDPKVAMGAAAILFAGAQL